jgi:fatty acid desaturase
MLFGFEAKAMLAPGKRMSVLGTTPALTRAEKVRAGLFYSAVVVLLTIADAWLPFLILWVLPLMTLSAMFVHWRTVAEHLGLAGTGDVSATRHVNANFFERLTFAPLAVNYHLDHHLFPGVPFYNLPQLHQRLLQEPIYCRNAIIKDGYFGRNSVFSDVVVAKHAVRQAPASVVKR